MQQCFLGEEILLIDLVWYVQAVATLVELSAFLAGDERVEGKTELQKGAWGMTVSIQGRTVEINKLFFGLREHS